MTTYAQVAAFARSRYLPALPAPAPMSDLQAQLHRALGGMLLSRWFRRDDGVLPEADAKTLEAARAMLEGWCAASDQDESPVIPPELEAGDLATTARRVLVHAMRDWQR